MRLPTIVSGFTKMDSKMSNSNREFSVETGSTVSANDLLPMVSAFFRIKFLMKIKFGILFQQYGRNEPTAILVAKLISRTLILITMVISILVLFSIYMQAKSTRCDYGMLAKVCTCFGTFWNFKIFLFVRKVEMVHIMNL